MNINNMRGIWRLNRIYKLLFFKLLPYPKIVKCNICNWSGRRFLDDSWLKKIQCPNCASDYRHRLLFESLNKIALFNKDLSDKKIIHFAPEEFFIPCFRNRSKYITADYNRTDVDLNLDISNMSEIADGVFDLVIASDVLEHVYDDRKAIFEIHRILKVGGRAILTVPQKDNLKITIEDLTDISKVERKRKFGQDDHYRIYGVDFYNKLQTVNFNINIFDADSFSKKERSFFILSPPIFGKHPMVTNYRRIYHAMKKS